MEEVLDQITAFADQAHGEQTRKFTPERYMVHPVRVMNICKDYTQDPAVLGAALLHDVLEDTKTSKQDIETFLLTVMDKDTALKTLQLVVELTDVYVKANYPHWNRRKRKRKEAERMQATSADAQTIKYADIIDNSTEVIVYDPVFARLFLAECKTLLTRITRGDKRLYQRAVETVNDCLQKVQVSKNRPGNPSYPAERLLKDGPLS